MSFDLTNKNIQDTFQNLLQRTGSDNRLYDLTGNEIGDLRISGSLIAQQYIVSSSVTNITTQQLSGSTQFGDSLDDTHQFTGAITASGNISASGTINANNVQINGAGLVSNVAAPATQGRLTQTKDGLGGTINLTDLGTTGNPTFNNITADTDIFVARNIAHVGDTGTSINFDTGKISINPNQIVLDGHITASGDISSSGNLTTIQITSSGHFIGQLPPDGGDNVLRYLKTSGDASSVKIEMGDLTGDAGGGTKLVLDDDATKVDISGNLLVSGILSSSGDLTSRGGTIERGLVINNDGGAFAAVIKGNTDDNLFLANVTPSGIDKVAIGTNSFLSKLTIGGDLTTTSHITSSGNISASGDIFAHSGSFTYITASIIDVDADTIRLGGETFKKSDVQKLKQGKTLKPILAGRAHGDLVVHDGNFVGNITSSGNISASGTIFGNDIKANGVSVVKSITDLSDVVSNQGKIQFGNTAGASVTKNIANLGSDDSPQFNQITASSDISIGGDIFNTQEVQMTNSSSAINTFNTGSHQTCKYLLQVTSGSYIQSSEMLVMQNSSNAFNTEYAQINSGLNLVDFSSKVNGANIELIGSSSFISCSVKFNRVLI